MQNIQNKIDRLIQNGNEEFSQQSNVIGALVIYTRIKELFHYLDRKYKVQTHEVLVRIAISWDILGNYHFALEYLNKALEIIKNIPCLVIYQSFLEQSMKLDTKAQEHLMKYKQLVGKKGKKYAELFRIVFYYTGNYNRDILLSEINAYFIKYPKCTVLLYLRALIYFEVAKEKEKSTHQNKKTINELLFKYESDINEALKIETNDTNFLIRDGITRGNITKLFFMILPEMDYYQPKPLVNYSSFQCGFKLFYLIFKCIKLFKAKLQKKKLKSFYIKTTKLVKLRDSSPELISTMNYNNNYTNDNKKTSNSNNKRLSKSPPQSSDRKRSVLNRNKELTIQCELIQLKEAYNNKIAKINSSVFFSSMNLFDDIRKYDLDIDISSNFFIKNKHYAPFNLSSNILSLKEIIDNDDPYNQCNNEDEISIAFSNQVNDNKIENTYENNNQMFGFGNCISNQNIDNDTLYELSMSLIKAKPNQESDFNVTNELKFFDPKETPVHNNVTPINTNCIPKKIPDLFNIKQNRISKPLDSIKKLIKIDFNQALSIKTKETNCNNNCEVETPKSSLDIYNKYNKNNIQKKQLVLLNYKEICEKRRISPDIIEKNLRINLVFGKKKRMINRQLNESNKLDHIDLKSNSNQQDKTGQINNTNEY